MKELLQHAIHAAVAAGDEILKVYQQAQIKVEEKSDSSPLTLADKNSHDVISLELAKTKLPILSEEGVQNPYVERKNWDEFWMVDPLDGTQEFLKKNDEFTVNIALIKDNFPILGVIYIPISGWLYFAQKKEGAFRAKINPNGSLLLSDLLVEKLPLPNPQDNPQDIRILASRSNMNEDTRAYIDAIKNEGKNVSLQSAGSAVKFCLVAEGAADIYPRFAPTMEWDTAAGQILVEEAGKKLVKKDGLERLQYNKESLLNPFFLVY